MLFHTRKLAPSTSLWEHAPFEWKLKKLINHRPLYFRHQGCFKIELH
jgi:hypothetical protein